MFNFFSVFLQFLRYGRITVISNVILVMLMTSDIRQDIENLEKDVLRLEDNIEEFSRLKYDEGIKEAIYQIQSNLKYLSILANGAPIEKNEDRRIMDFLRIHYGHLQKLSVPL